MSEKFKEIIIEKEKIKLRSLLKGVFFILIIAALALSLRHIGNSNKNNLTINHKLEKTINNLDQLQAEQEKLNVKLDSIQNKLNNNIQDNEVLEKVFRTVDRLESEMKVLKNEGTNSSNLPGGKQTLSKNLLLQKELTYNTEIIEKIVDDKIKILKEKLEKENKNRSNYVVSVANQKKDYNREKVIIFIEEGVKTAIHKIRKVFERLKKYGEKRMEVD